MIELSKDNNDSSSNDLGAVVLEKDPEVKEPPSYQVILLNDDYTPMEFVVFVLQSVFGHNHQKSTEIMMEVCLLYTSPSPRDKRQSRMPSSA